MAHHDLKIWPENYTAVDDGDKRAEYRKEDGGRFFEVGDVLTLHEWSPAEQKFTGRRLYREVTHLVRGPEFDVPAGYVVLSIR